MYPAKRERHRRILEILARLDAEFLARCRALFGGGTLISLLHGEFRLSLDIDFLCSVDEGYRLLRTVIGERGYRALFASREGVLLHREIRADQYGGAHWQLFGAGLPAVQVSDLYLPADGSFLRVSTYGRGIWQVAL
ncbi:nucleotidyl transferase AbiEii/AbiGii toxin family protein [Gloeobacter violaceus]|uniref:Glr1624 protein n=1 Tax=Gloeobacter violaceus (strain ATCC 29082 / PCC 7421) TaxID=251221 RepID=Q7NK56_GLOVI|nr:nucleotidyl transferase AbiEii/AbiGii toxin family protein [Gloeobacter violaceus]BAC89565.1 glr1624 [Gloeobacter violaceus PCC 7421]